MLKSKYDVRREIDKISSSYSDQDIFSSKYFGEILSHVVFEFCYKLGRVPKLRTYWADNNDTAVTDCTNIEANTNSPLVRDLNTRWQKYTANVGHVVHECGHVLFTDFQNLNKAREGYENVNGFEFYPHIPSDIETAKKMQEYMKKHRNISKYFGFICSNLVNILEDVYIENRLYGECSGVCAAGLHLTNEEKWRNASSQEDLYKKIDEKEIDKLYALLCEIQIRALGKFNNFQMKTDGSAEYIYPEIYKNFADFFEKANPFIDRLSWEQNGYTRCELFNELAVLMWIFFDPKEDEETPEKSQKSQEGEGQEGDGENNEGQNGESQGSNNQNSKNKNSKKKGSKGQGSQSSSQNGSQDSEESESMSKDDFIEAINQMTDDELEQLAKDMAKELTKNGATQMPTGTTAPVKKGKSEQEIKGEISEDKKNANNISKNEESLKRYLQQAVDEIAKEEFEQNAADKQVRELQKEALQIKNTKLTKNIVNWHYKVTRSQPNDYYKDIYNNIYRRIESISKTTQRKLKNILKVREMDEDEDGYLMGEKFNPQDVYHRNGKYFSQEGEPSDKPSVAFSVILDMSGSMSGAKAEKAQECAIILEDILRGLEIPFILTGHNVCGNKECHLFSYVDFDTLDDKDRYRLIESTMFSGGCNRDAAAISYGCEKLLKRNEKAKVCIVISDGIPTECGPVFKNYNINSLQDNVKDCVDHYRSKDIDIFAAVIDDNMEDFDYMYSKQYTMDCKNLNVLSESLIKLVKRYVLKRN